MKDKIKELAETVHELGKLLDEDRNSAREVGASHHGTANDLANPSGRLDRPTPSGVTNIIP